VTGVQTCARPISLRGLIDSAATQEHQIALLWQAIEKLAGQADPDCVPTDAARQEKFAADRLNELVGK
jgi:serine O-acetyltransferase